MKRKSGLSKFNGFLAIVLVICVVATAFVINKYPKIEDASADDSSNTQDVAVIDEFKAGTYGGKEFKTQEDVVNYYKECYDYTKTLTAEYKTDSGETHSYYKMLGTETLDVNNLLVEGKSNDIINKLVPGIVGNLFHGGTNGLSPSVTGTLRAIQGMTERWIAQSHFSSLMIFLQQMLRITVTVLLQ